MEAILICYTLEKITQTQRTALNRVINGYKDFSNKGNYSYKRKGILQEIPNIKPHNSVIIVRKRDKDKILDILKKFHATIKKFNITINSELLQCQKFKKE